MADSTTRFLKDHDEMGAHICEWDRDHSAPSLAEVAELWNKNARERHAFHPWSGELLASLIAADGRSIGRLIAARESGGRLVGFSHVSMLEEEGYPRAGVVEMLLVDDEWRRRGIGTALLREAVHLLAAQPAPPIFIDALGAWPFGSVYNVLADGSERSGVFLREEEIHRLFLRAGFAPVRKSVVMRAELAGTVPRPIPPDSGFNVDRRRGGTWLDRVFRGRELWDHEFGKFGGRLLSRAIFGLMEGESRQEGRNIFSLFGVNTPRDQQNKGYAGINISNLMEHVRQVGGDVLELHVYADNEPALALYRGLGFKPVAETMMMHLLL